MAKSSPVMERRVPKNAKYENVQSKINSGSTIQKVRHISANQAVRRRNENFIRLAPSELYQLLSEYESGDTQEDIGIMRGGAQDFNPRIVTHEAEAEAAYERPYLIIDVRDAQDYGEAHVLQARSFPQRLLMQDRQTKEMVHYRNREGCLVILYCADGRQSAAAAQILTTRGFDNAYVLEGGISAFAQRFPAYVDGDASILSQNVSPRANGASGGNSRSASTSSSSYSKRDQMRSARSQMDSSCSERSRARSSSSAASANQPASVNRMALSRVNRHNGRPTSTAQSTIADEGESRMSNATVADSVISNAAIRKQRPPQRRR